MQRRAALELPVPGLTRVVVVGVTVTKWKAVVGVAGTTGIEGSYRVLGRDWVGVAQVLERPDLICIIRGSSSYEGGDGP